MPKISKKNHGRAAFEDVLNKAANGGVVKTFNNKGEEVGEVVFKKPKDPKNSNA